MAFLPNLPLSLCIITLFITPQLPARNLESRALLVFGDSTVDPGNNNFIITTFRSNFWPYGKDFVNQTATGRFTNGRLATDLIAKYVGAKDYVPPYLDPTLTVDQLITGVSFASAGSGFDPLTPQVGNVIPMLDQLAYFKEYKSKLEAAVGEKRANDVVTNALFLVSAGTNDFVVNYFTLPVRRVSYTVSRYTDFVQLQARQFLQGLIAEGARRIGVAGLPPMGSLPVVITLYADDPFGNRGSVDSFSAVARDYNEKLRTSLDSIQKEFTSSSGIKIGYMDVYGPMEEMTGGYKYEFEEAKNGCCGTGLVETSFLCNAVLPVCADATKYVFWDSIHPTERTYGLLFEVFRPVIDKLVAS